MKLHLSKEFREFVELLNANDVRYVLLGGYAVAWHGYPRFTKNMDFYVERSPENAARILAVIEAFGMTSIGITLDDLLAENSGIFIGVPPYRIDIINFADGITFEQAWNTRENAEIDGLPIHIISRDLLIRNKLASGRGQDRLDAETLEKRAR